MSAAPIIDFLEPEARLPMLKRSQALVVTSWYPTPDSPFSYPFITDHLESWTRWLFEDGGEPLAVIHPQEAISVLSAVKHRLRPFRGENDEGAWRVVHTQPWRVKRRWSESDLSRELRELKSALSRFPWFGKQPPKLIVAQTLSAARQSLLLRKSLSWKTPVVLVEHSSPLAMQFQVPAAEPHQKRALQEVDAVIAVSHNLAESISEIWGGRLPHVIPNPVDPRAFSTPLPPRWSRGCLRLVNVGFCTEQKAQEVLIRSVGILVNRGLDVALEILGDGPERPRLERLASAAGLFGRINFRGSQPRDEVLSALARSHIFVFPSRWENCPVALEEAQAVGLPVVVTQNGASEKILVHDDSRVCPVDDPHSLAMAVEELTSSPIRETAERRREKARMAFAQQYFAERCKGVFSKVITMVEDEQSSSICPSM